jgi:hypothetical protein
MKFDPVFLLVVLAVFLMVFLPFFDKDSTIPKHFRSSKRRRVLLSQLTILVLLISTVATLAWPIRGMHSLIQGVIFSSVVLVPAFIFHLLASLHYRSTYSEAAITSESGTQGWFAPGEDFFAGDSQDGNMIPRNVVNPKGFDANAPIDFGIDSMPVIHLPKDYQWSDELETNEVSKTPESQDAAAAAAASARKPLTNAAVLSGIPGSYPDSDKNSETAVVEQLERVSQLVQSHDLGDQNTISLHGDNELGVHEKKNSSLPPRFNGLTSVADNTTDLKSLGRSEMSGLVTSLRKDNGRLQKLVIAQHAVIESQRETHNRSTDAARDAVKIRRDAQSRQKMAEKIARREKTERQRINDEYQKVTSVFENAMSIISMNRESSAISDGA